MWDGGAGAETDAEEKPEGYTEGTAGGVRREEGGVLAAKDRKERKEKEGDFNEERKIGRWAVETWLGKKMGAEK